MKNDDGRKDSLDVTWREFLNYVRLFFTVLVMKQVVWFVYVWLYIYDQVEVSAMRQKGAWSLNWKATRQQIGIDLKTEPETALNKISSVTTSASSSLITWEFLLLLIRGHQSPFVSN